MSKVTKKQLQHSVDLLNKENSDQHEYLMRINRALRSIGIDILSEAFDKTQPQLKQLDQSVFNGLDEKWKSAATNSDGKSYLHNEKKDMMYFNHNSYGWCSKDYDRHEMQLIGDNFDPSGFAVGFIERESELTGSNLARAMLARGDKYVMCLVSDDSQEDALLDGCSAAISSTIDNGCFYGYDFTWIYAIPINNQGEPLTASEVGL